MMKKICFIFAVILVWARVALSQAKGLPAPTPSWVEHLDVVQSLIGILFVIISWLLMRTLNKIDRNQTRMFDRLEILEKEFSELRGEHNAIKGMHGGRRKTDPQ